MRAQAQGRWPASHRLQGGQEVPTEALQLRVETALTVFPHCQSCCLASCPAGGLGGLSLFPLCVERGAPAQDGSGTLCIDFMGQHWADSRGGGGWDHGWDCGGRAGQGCRVRPGLQAGSVAGLLGEAPDPLSLPLSGQSSVRSRECARGVREDGSPAPAPAWGAPARGTVSSRLTHCALAPLHGSVLLTLTAGPRESQGRPERGRGTGSCQSPASGNLWLVPGPCALVGQRAQPSAAQLLSLSTEK